MNRIIQGNELIEVNGHRISFYDVSCIHSNRSEKPTGVYVVLHGALGTSETTVDFAKILAEKVKNTNMQVLLVDLPGHGESPEVALTSVKEIAEKITDFCRYVKESIQYGDEIYLVGHSMGGSVVLQMLAKGFDAKKASILMSGSDWSSMEGMHLIQEDQILDIFNQMMTGEFEHLPEREAYISRIPFMAASPKAALADIKALSTFDILAEVGNIKTPLLIVASELDQTATAESIEALASKLNSYDSHVLMGGTHTSVIGRAEEVAGIVANF